MIFLSFFLQSVTPAVRILSVDHVLVESFDEQFTTEEQTREDAQFAFVVEEAPDLEAASIRLDQWLDEQ